MSAVLRAQFVPIPAPQVSTRPIVMRIKASAKGAGGYPIEIGFVLEDRSTFCTLIRPTTGWTAWYEPAEVAHGITRDILQQHGRDVADVAALLDRQLAGRTVHCTGWTEAYSLLQMLYDAAERRLTFHLESLDSLLSPQEVTRFKQARDDIRSRQGVRRHRASADAKLDQQAFYETRTG